MPPISVPITAIHRTRRLLVLVGTGPCSGRDIDPVSRAASRFPNNGRRGRVIVTINGINCAIYLSRIPPLCTVAVPYAEGGAPAGLVSLRNIQVNNNGVLSNVVQLYLAPDAVPEAPSP